MAPIGRMEASIDHRDGTPDREYRRVAVREERVAPIEVIALPMDMIVVPIGRNVRPIEEVINMTPMESTVLRTAPSAAWNP